MPDFGAYIGWHPTGDFEEWYRQFNRADSVGFMIGHRGNSLVLMRNSTALDAQDLLLVPAGRNTTANEIGSETGVAAKEQLLVIGRDTADMQKGDRFRYPASTVRLNYEIVRVEKALHGMLQAYAEETQ